MMTPTGAGEKAHTRNSRSSKLLPSWQRALLGFYVALFSLVLPLVCWGALAEPGHPHRYPHLVFANPMLIATPDRTALPKHQAQAVTAQRTPLRHREHSGPPGVADIQASISLICDMLSPGVIPGRATPTLLLFSILLLIFFAAWRMRPLNPPHFALWQPLSWPQEISLPVALPPPRSSTHAALAQA
jgi:hypothetical protein